MSHQKIEGRFSSKEPTPTRKLTDARRYSHSVTATSNRLWHLKKHQIPRHCICPIVNRQINTCDTTRRHIGNSRSSEFIDQYGHIRVVSYHHNLPIPIIDLSNQIQHIPTMPRINALVPCNPFFGKLERFAQPLDRRSHALGRAAQHVIWFDLPYPLQIFAHARRVPFSALVQGPIKISQSDIAPIRLGVPHEIEPFHKVFSVKVLHTLKYTQPMGFYNLIFTSEEYKVSNHSVVGSPLGAGPDCAPAFPSARDIARRALCPTPAPSAY